MISFSEFRDALSNLHGQRFTTLRKGVGFTLRLFEEGPEYTPDSSGAPRDDTWTSIARVIERFNDTGSFRPADYTDLTHHSSYVLTLLKTVLTRGPESAGFTTAVSDLPADTGQADRPELTEQSGESSAPDPRPHQRLGSVSNAHVGSDFENVARQYFARNDIVLTPAYPVEIGLTRKKIHYFDLGSSAARVLVECKSHKWTAGGRVPSAKMTVWNEAMFYFLLAPPEYRKILFVLHDRRDKGGELLLAYYKRTHGHMIPDNVEFIEWDEESGDIARV